MVASSGENDGPEVEVRAARRQRDLRIVGLAVQLAPAEKVERRGDHVAAVALAQQADTALRREALDEPGEVIPRNIGPAALLVDIPDIVAIDPLAGPVERDHDGFRKHRPVLLEPAMRPEQAAEGHVGRRQASLHLDQHRLADRLLEEDSRVGLDEFALIVKMSDLQTWPWVGPHFLGAVPATDDPEPREAVETRLEMVEEHERPPGARVEGSIRGSSLLPG